MRTKLYSLCLVFAVGFVTLTTPLATVAGETIQRTVRGTVIASSGYPAENKSLRLTSP
jgi:hypothetical protein